MKVCPVYKCDRCGEIIVMDDVLLDVDEISCVENVNTHVCDVGVFITPHITPGYQTADAVGIIRLVGYDEVQENV